MLKRSEGMKLASLEYKTSGKPEGKALALGTSVRVLLLVSMGPGFHSDFSRQKTEIIIIIRELIHGKGNLAFRWTSRRMLCLLSKSALRWAKGILPKWCCESEPNKAPARAERSRFCLMDASAYDSGIDAPEVCLCALSTHGWMFLWHCALSKPSGLVPSATPSARMEVGLP